MWITARDEYANAPSSSSSDLENSGIYDFPSSDFLHVGWENATRVSIRWRKHRNPCFPGSEVHRRIRHVVTDADVADEVSHAVPRCRLSVAFPSPELGDPRVTSPSHRIKPSSPSNPPSSRVGGRAQIEHQS
ncbi:hypothetical protein MUK42_27995 [Musa troglodytarum]|uniref:Uncharacterized protein n=1 Tax=Musa troglodytarum TaxID=320322 RepID=A0A9E7FHK8_9LILI|nr:hypothetical protein MUK42_27995 [Musa troglodytarum]